MSITTEGTKFPSSKPSNSIQYNLYGTCQRKTLIQESVRNPSPGVTISHAHGKQQSFSQTIKRGSVVGFTGGKR